MALCWADILAIQIWEGSSNALLLLSMGLPEPFTGGCFSSRLPAAFQTFSSLRETFPEVSGYCYCSDSLGRELADTGEYLPAPRMSTSAALNSQGEGQVKSVSV